MDDDANTKKEKKREKEREEKRKKKKKGKKRKGIRNLIVRVNGFGSVARRVIGSVVKSQLECIYPSRAIITDNKVSQSQFCW